MRMPLIELNCSEDTSAVVLPVAKLSWPGRFFATSTSSATDLAGSPALT